MPLMMSDTFDPGLFETVLESLRNTQDGIQQLSSWCLEQRSNHKKIIACWLKVLKRVRVEKRLVLFYLANDVIQYSKRKRYEFVASWTTALQRATTMVRDEKVREKINRIFNIWEQRQIYSEDFINGLQSLLNINAAKQVLTSTEAIYDFQCEDLIMSIQKCVELSKATELSFAELPKSPCVDDENFKNMLKDRPHSEDMEKELENYVACGGTCANNLQAEIDGLKALISNLQTGTEFFAHQEGELKICISAYKRHGRAIRYIGRKIDHMIPYIESPIPSPDLNAPSPSSDEDMLPDDKNNSLSMNTFSMSSINGSSSYLHGDLPFDIKDFTHEGSNIKTASPAANQPMELTPTYSDNQSDSFNSPSEYYTPESFSPMPVPPVQPEYLSMTQPALQYGVQISPPQPPLFGSNNFTHGYNSYMPTYNDNSYQWGNNGGTGSSTARDGAFYGMPLMPPPMPPRAIMEPEGDGVNFGGVAGQQNNDDFYSSYFMNSWPQLHSSYEASPPFNATQSDYANNNAVAHPENRLETSQDVDHRQINLSIVAANLGVKFDPNNGSW